MEYWIVMCTRLRGEFSAIGLIIKTVYITKQRLFFAVAGKSPLRSMFPNNFVEM